MVAGKAFGETGLRGAEKAATLILAAGKDSAKRLAEHLSEDEIRAIFAAASRLGQVSMRDVETVAEEFRENFDETGVVSEPEKLKGLFSAFKPGTDYLAFMGNQPVESEAPVSAGLDVLTRDHLKLIVEFAENEHPQAVAYLLSRLAPELVAPILAELPSELRKTIAQRFLALAPAEGPLTAEFEEHIKSRFFRSESASGDDESLDKAASLLTQMEREETDELLAFLDARDARRSSLLRQRLFRFEDITKLEKQHLARLFDGVAPETVARCVTGQSTEFVEMVFSVLSQRNRRGIEAELAGGSITAEQAAEGRRVMVATGMRLLREGAIVINRGEEGSQP